MRYISAHAFLEPVWKQKFLFFSPFLFEISVGTEMFPDVPTNRYFKFKDALPPFLTI